MSLREPSPNMVIDVVDTKNRPIGTTKRKDVFKGEGGFRTVHAFIFNSKGMLLLQQQSRKRDRAPLTWGSSVAGYIFSGETYEEAAKRRIEQELGLKLSKVSLVGVARINDLGHDKFVGLVECRSEGPFRIDKTQIERIEFTDLHEVVSRWRKGDMAFTPTFLALLRLYRRIRGKPSSQQRRSSRTL